MNHIQASVILLRRFLPVAVIAACIGQGSSARADLPASGTGWTLTGSDNAWVLNDVVDSSGWAIITGGVFATTTTNGLDAQAGTGFFNGANSGATANRGIDRYFTGLTLQAGTYTVDISFGAFSGGTFQAPSIYFLSDGASNGYNYNDRIGGVVASAANTAPSAGGWTTYSYTFDVTASTTNVDGYSVVGTQLGFMVLGNVATGKSYAADNLSVSFTAAAIPEPSASAMIAGGALLAAAMVWRRQRFFR